jgi:hypothetical protein
MFIILFYLAFFLVSLEILDISFASIVWIWNSIVLFSSTVHTNWIELPFLIINFLYFFSFNSYYDFYSFLLFSSVFFLYFSMTFVNLSYLHTYIHSFYYSHIALVDPFLYSSFYFILLSSGREFFTFPLCLTLFWLYLNLMKPSFHFL